MGFARGDSRYVPFQFSLAAALICITAFATMLSLVVYWKGRPHRLGRSRADADWAAHTAVIYRPDNEYVVQGQYSIVRWYDAQTGLELRSYPHSESFRRGYNDRLYELLGEYGPPPWSARASIPRDEELVAMLHLPSMHAVTAFPYEVTPHIALVAEVRDRHRSVHIVTRRSTLGCPHLDGSVFVARKPAPADTVFIRGGDRWVVAYSSDGRKLAEVSTLTSN